MIGDAGSLVAGISPIRNFVLLSKNFVPTVMESWGLLGYGRSCVTRAFLAELTGWRGSCGKMTCRAFPRKNVGGKKDRRTASGYQKSS